MGAVLGVRRLLTAGDQHAAILAGCDERISDLHRVEHTVAGVYDVHHRLDQVLAGARENEQVDRAGAVSQHVT